MNGCAAVAQVPIQTRPLSGWLSAAIACVANPERASAESPSDDQNEMRMEKSSDCYRHTELRVRRKKARKGAWSDATMSGRRAIRDIGAGKGHVVTFHFHPMHGNMVRAVGFHTVLPRSSNETCPAFVWRTNGALPVP